MTARDYSTAWVCVDCYFAHHYGATEVDGKWYPGPDPAGTHEPADREPLVLLEGYELADDTDVDGECEDFAERGTGEQDFSWSSCDGCGSTLGGSRHRLACFTPHDDDAALRCPECGEPVWDGPHGSKLAKCWNAEGHADGGALAFDTMDDDDNDDGAPCVTEPPAAENTAPKSAAKRQAQGDPIGHCGAWHEHEARGESHVYRGPIDCGCGWGDLCDVPREPARHWHVAYGIAGYGPDGADGFARFDSLSDALEYARDLLGESADVAWETASGYADAGQFEDAWNEVVRSEDLIARAANLDPARRQAPLYRDDPDAYAALQASLAELFPVDVSRNSRLYLWECELTAECEHDGEEG